MGFVGPFDGQSRKMLRGVGTGIAACGDDVLAQALEEGANTGGRERAGAKFGGQEFKDQTFREAKQIGLGALGVARTMLGNGAKEQGDAFAAGSLKHAVDAARGLFRAQPAGYFQRRREAPEQTERRCHFLDLRRTDWSYIGGVAPRASSVSHQCPDEARQNGVHVAFRLSVDFDPFHVLLRQPNGPQSRGSVRLLGF